MCPFLTAPDTLDLRAPEPRLAARSASEGVPLGWLRAAISP